MTVTKQRFILYPNAAWYFALAMLITWIGFSQSYFLRLKQNDIYHHLHGATAGLWMALMIVQPILYNKGKLKLHRRLGKVASIILVPLLILGGFKMMHMMLLAAAAYPPNIVYRLAFIDLYSLIMFPLLFGLSLYHGKKIHLHARYMAGTVLTILPPAITRLLFIIPWFNSFNKTLNGSFVITELVVLLLILDDKRSGKIRKPYIVILLLFAVLHIAMNFVNGWQWWKNVMDWYAKLAL